MKEILSRSWRMLALRGVIGILFGVLALVWPGLTLLVFAALFATYSLFTGVVLVIGSVRSRKGNEDWWLLFMIGLVGVGAGVITIVHPGLTALILVLVIGASAMVTGVLDIVAALRLRTAARNGGLLALNGIASLAFGVMIFLFPDAGALAIVLLFSFYAVVSGILVLTFAFRLRARSRSAAGTDRRITPDRRMSAAHA